MGSDGEKGDEQLEYRLEMAADLEEEVGEEGIETEDHIGIPVRGGAEGEQIVIRDYKRRKMLLVRRSSLYAPSEVNELYGKRVGGGEGEVCALAGWRKEKVGVVVGLVGEMRMGAQVGCDGNNRTAYDIPMRPFQVVRNLQTFGLKAHGWTTNKKGFPTWLMISRKSDISSKLLTCMHIKTLDVGLTVR